VRITAPQRDTSSYTVSLHTWRRTGAITEKILYRWSGGEEPASRCNSILSLRENTTETCIL